MENAYRRMRESTGLKLETEALITAAQDHWTSSTGHQVSQSEDTPHDK